MNHYTEHITKDNGLRKKYVNPFTSGHAFSEVIRILSENLSRELRSRMSEPNKEGR